MWASLVGSFRPGRKEAVSSNEAGSNVTAALLEVEGISKSFPGVRALHQVQFVLHPGEVLVLVGENGAGKSTLMKILSGIYQRDEGTIKVDGREVTIANPAAAQQLGISIIHQEMNLMPDLTVAQNIYIGREPHKGPFLDERGLNRKAQDLLDGLGIKLDARQIVGDLTVAKQQMVEIAKALSFDARVLIMDEPTSALTDSEVETLIGLIENLRAKGTGIVYISHRMEELKRLADRVTVLRDVSFDLHRGEILGFAGLMGAGRTETARAIIGADPRTSGTIEVHGKPVTIKQPADAVAHGIGYLSEDRKRLGLMLEQSVTFNTALASIGQFTTPLGFVQQAKAKKVAQRYVDELRTKTPSTEQMVKLLSGGNQQKVVIAKWLARDSEILIFDEPTRGIDVGAKEEIYRLLQRLAENGKSIIVISSELPEVLRLAHRIVVMANGRVTGTLANEDASQQKIMDYATHLVADEQGAA